VRERKGERGEMGVKVRERKGPAAGKCWSNMYSIRRARRPCVIDTPVRVLTNIV